MTGNQYIFLQDTILPRDDEDHFQTEGVFSLNDICGQSDNCIEDGNASQDDEIEQSSQV